MGLNGGRLRASCLVSAASVLTGGGLLINDIETFAIKSALAFVSLLGGRKRSESQTNLCLTRSQGRQDILPIAIPTSWSVSNNYGLGIFPCVHLSEPPFSDRRHPGTTPNFVLSK